MCYSVLKARYGEEGGQLKDGGRTSSVWWMGMVGIHDGIGIGVGNWFDENISKIVGDGRSTFFRMDNWIGEVPLCVRFSRLFDLAKNQTCSVAEMQQFGWDEGRRSGGECFLRGRRIFLGPAVFCFITIFRLV